MAETRNLQLVIQAKDDATKVLNGLKSSLGGIKTLLAGAGIAVGFGTMIAEAQEASRVNRVLETVIKSTGGAVGLTSQTIREQADALSKLTAIDGEVIQAGQNMLLTFTNIRGDAFQPATQAMLDMATAMNQGVQPTAEQLSGTAIQLGKALNNPIDGLASLSRVGVKFTEDQKKLIEGFMEQGDVMSAQKIILQELKTEFGGMAASTATPLAQLKTKVFDTAQAIGEKLLPVVNTLATYLLKAIDATIKFYTENKKTIDIVFSMVAAFAAVLVIGNKLIQMWSFMKVAIDAVSIGLKLLMAHPIILMLGLVAAAVTYLSVKFGGLVNAFAVIGAGLSILGNILLGSLKTMANAVISFINKSMKVGADMYNWFIKQANKLGLDLKEATAWEVPEFDVSINNENINANLDLITQLKNDASEASTEVNTMSNFIGNVPPIPASVGKSSDELKGKFDDLKEKIADTAQSSADALNEVGKKIVEITDKMFELTGQKRRDDISLGVDVGTAFVEQEKKINDLKLAIGAETDAYKKNQLQMELDREQRALDSRKNWELVYQTEIAEARVRASKTEFERVFDDLNKKKIALDDEFNYKMSALQNELKLEVEKFKKLKELNAAALIEADRFLALGEKQTLASVNREISYYNALAQAISRAKSGLTSGNASLIAGTNQRANATAPIININISGNTIAGTGGLNELATRVGNAITGQLNLNGVGIR